MRRARPTARPFRHGLVPVALAALLATILPAPGAADDAEAPKNPYLGEAEAIEKGGDIYRRYCVVCHGRAGGRGPKLFRTKLGDARFLKTVTNGRTGQRGKMPAFGPRLTVEEIWHVEAFVKSRDHL